MSEKFQPPSWATAPTCRAWLEVRATSAAPDAPPESEVRVDGAPWTSFGCDTDAATVHVDDRRVRRACGTGRRRARRNAHRRALVQGLRRAAAALPRRLPWRRPSLQRCRAASFRAARCALRFIACLEAHTDTHCHASLPSPARSATSRLHAAIVHHPSGKVYIIELNATHGTLVDSLRLEKHRPLQIKDGFRRVRARRFSRMCIAPLNAAC
jgi:hypothetical protein